ncbi:hypothetical protein ElyMa_003519500 [Elysia marginata]|uniref:HIG1 domain-containing protein n=1 Tax=Elysia marginata TaxID=1093978 RepID=A0AAV4EH61_9GAST|nr:hypothetical protein ElyMa_003519500 [Elysia marginata]
MILLPMSHSITVASRTAAKPRHHHNLSSTNSSSVAYTDITRYDLTEEGHTTLGIFPPLPVISIQQQNGTPPLSLFLGEDATDPAIASTSQYNNGWQYQRLGTVSHTALGLSASPAVAPTRGFSLLSSEPRGQSSGSSSSQSQRYSTYNTYTESDSGASTSPLATLSSYSNGHSGRLQDGGGWGKDKRRRTGLACLPAGLSGLLRPSVLLRSSWRKLTRMERPKLYSLVGLVVQTSALALTMRYSRTSQDKEHRYRAPFT